MGGFPFPATKVRTSHYLSPLSPPPLSHRNNTPNGLSSLSFPSLPFVSGLLPQSFLNRPSLSTTHMPPNPPFLPLLLTPPHGLLLLTRPFVSLTNDLNVSPLQFDVTHAVVSALLGTQFHPLPFPLLPVRSSVSSPLHDHSPEADPLQYFFLQTETHTINKSFHPEPGTVVMPASK